MRFLLATPGSIWSAKIIEGERKMLRVSMQFSLIWGGNFDIICSGVFDLLASSQSLIPISSLRNETLIPGPGRNIFKETIQESQWLCSWCSSHVDHHVWAVIIFRKSGGKRALSIRYFTDPHSTCHSVNRVRPEDQAHFGHVKSLNLPEPQLPHLENRNSNCADSIGTQ